MSYYVIPCHLAEWESMFCQTMSFVLHASASWRICLASWSFLLGILKMKDGKNDNHSNKWERLHSYFFHCLPTSNEQVHVFPVQEFPPCRRNVSPLWPRLALHAPTAVNFDTLVSQQILYKKRRCSKHPIIQWQKMHLICVGSSVYTPYCQTILPNLTFCARASASWIAQSASLWFASFVSSRLPFSSHVS